MSNIGYILKYSHTFCMEPQVNSGTILYMEKSLRWYYIQRASWNDNVSLGMINGFSRKIMIFIFPSLVYLIKTLDIALSFKVIRVLVLLPAVEIFS